MQRNQTNGDTTPELSEQQRTACDLIVAGRTLQDVAEAISVARPTVSRWLNHEPAFIAAVNARRQELWETSVDGLRGLLPQALKVLKAELDGPQPLQAALAVLKTAGLTGSLGRPSGPITVEAVEQEMRQREIEREATALTAEDVELAQRKRQQDRMFAELTL